MPGARGRRGITGPKKPKNPIKEKIARKKKKRKQEAKQLKRLVEEVAIDYFKRSLGVEEPAERIKSAMSQLTPKEKESLLSYARQLQQLGEKRGVYPHELYEMHLLLRVGDLRAIHEGFKEKLASQDK